MRIKNRILKKHNNQNYMNGIYQKQAALGYAHGLKVFELGYYTNQPNGKTFFMAYSTQPKGICEPVYFHKFKTCKRTPHPITEFETGDICQYCVHLENR